MEQELFDWKNWDGDPECMIFYNVILKVDIGEHKAGHNFEYVSIRHSDGQGTLEFYNNGVVADTYKLHYRVGERLDSPPATDKHGNG